MKVVFDANVIIAAFATRGICESIIEVCLSEHEIVLCHDLADEILRNLESKIKLPKTVVDDIGKLLLEQSSTYDPMPLPLDVCRDPDDVKILGLAAASDAEYIVTGDKDLLVLENFRDIPIINPRSFSDILHTDKISKNK